MLVSVKTEAQLEVFQQKLQMYQPLSQSLLYVWIKITSLGKCRKDQLHLLFRGNLICHQVFVAVVPILIGFVKSLRFLLLQAKYLQESSSHSLQILIHHSLKCFLSLLLVRLDDLYCPQAQCPPRSNGYSKVSMSRLC